MDTGRRGTGSGTAAAEVRGTGLSQPHWTRSRTSYVAFAGTGELRSHYVERRIAFIEDAEQVLEDGGVTVDIYAGRVHVPAEEREHPAFGEGKLHRGRRVSAGRGVS